MTTGRITALTAAAAGGLTTSIDYTYDNVGNPTRVTTTRNGVVSTEGYVYDAANRLTRACYFDQRDPGECDDQASSTIAYTYDGVGNRLREARVGVDNPGQVTYTDDAADQLLSRGATTYTYDADGNQTGAGPVTRVFGELNRLVEVDDGTDVTTIAYDPLGNRHTVTTGSATTSFAWDVNHPLPELIGVDDGAQATTYRHGPMSRPLAATINGADHALVADALGSITDVVGADTGDLLRHTGYEPFGAPREATEVVPGTPAVGLGFTGEYTDPDTGLIHLRARDYDPITGRFTAVDPATPRLDDPYVATYAYVNNRPTVLTDPSGNCPWEWCKDLFGEIGDVAGEIGEGIGNAWNYLLDEGPPSRQEIGLGLSTGFVRGVEETATWLTGFDDPEFQQMIGWDGRLLSDRMEEAFLSAGLDSTYFCAASLIGEYGFYGGTATTGGAAALGTRAAKTATQTTTRSTTAAAENAGSKLKALSGREIKIGQNSRIAPLGNRTGHPTGRFPHYHRRGVDQDGNTLPGHGIGRHRPWDKKSTDKSFWDRF